ncbi:MAG: toprim domain-containing protein, partial [Paraclostridium sp.]
ARNARDDMTQGLYPLKGKIPNAFNTTREKMINNEDIAGIISIVGAGYGKNFDLARCKANIDKLIIACDADFDGRHIRAGILKFVLMYMRPLLEAGMLYSLMPPLYSIKTGTKGGKEQFRYLTDRLSYIEYLQSLFMKDNSIHTVRGNKLSKKELSKLLMDNIDYTYELEKVANNYAIDHNLFETILLNINNIDDLKRILFKNYRFMEKVEILADGSIFIKGLVNQLTQTFIINDKLLYECKAILEYININEYMHYNLNGQVVSLYTLMKHFESYTPKQLQRFKGLGYINSPL